MYQGNIGTWIKPMALIDVVSMLNNVVPSEVPSIQSRVLDHLGGGS